MSHVSHDAIVATLRRCASILADAEVDFMLGGSIACWARGGPRSQNDLDLMLPRDQAQRAFNLLVESGMRGERPPEAWLLKVFDGEVMIDLIFQSLGTGPITTAMIAEAECLSVVAIDMPVMSLEDIMSSKLLSISEQRLDFGPPLEIARALRERIDWRKVRRSTEGSPYARAFFALLAELDVLHESRGAGGAIGSLRQIPL